MFKSRYSKLRLNSFLSACAVSLGSGDLYQLVVAAKKSEPTNRQSLIDKIVTHLLESKKKKNKFSSHDLVFMLLGDGGGGGEITQTYFRCYFGGARWGGRVWVKKNSKDTKMHAQKNSKNLNNSAVSREYRYVVEWEFEGTEKAHIEICNQIDAVVLGEGFFFFVHMYCIKTCNY